MTTKMSAPPSYPLLLAAVLGAGCPLSPNHLTEPPWEADVVGTVSVVEQFPDGEQRLAARVRERSVAERLRRGDVLDTLAIVGALDALLSAYREVGVDIYVDTRLSPSTPPRKRTFDVTFTILPGAEPTSEPAYRLSIHDCGNDRYCGNPPTPREVLRGVHGYLLDSAGESGRPSLQGW